MPDITRDSSAEGVSIGWPLLRSRPKLRIGQPVLERLSADELTAAAAHEIGHLAQGIRKVELLKLLSILGLYPNYYLTILIDFVASEYDADKFAVDSGVSPRLLARAIMGGSTGHATPQPEDEAQTLTAWMERKLRITGLRATVEFYFGSGLPGYAYPLLGGRLRYLNDLAMTQGD